MDKIIFLIFFMMFSLVANAQLFEGTVLDKSSNEPLIGVSIFISDEIATATDINGSFVIKLEEGFYSAEFSFIGYEFIINFIKVIFSFWRTSFFRCLLFKIYKLKHFFFHKLVKIIELMSIE